MKENCFGLSKRDTTYSTYKSMFVADVVGELQFVKRDDFLHPLFAGGWAVGMDVHAFWHFRISFPGDHPSTVVGTRTA